MRLTVSHHFNHSFIQREASKIVESNSLELEKVQLLTLARYYPKTLLKPKFENSTKPLLLRILRTYLSHRGGQIQGHSTAELHPQPF